MFHRAVIRQSYCDAVDREQEDSRYLEFMGITVCNCSPSPWEAEGEDCMSLKLEAT